MASKEYTESYLLEQREAMIWLREQGVSCEQIRDMRWGMVDESGRCLRFPTSVTSLLYDKDTQEISQIVEEKPVMIDIRDSGHEWFFLKSKYKCPWMFTREVPHTWKREESREYCYSLEAVENLTKTANSPVIFPILEVIDELTNNHEFGSMKVAIADITNQKTKEQTRGLVAK